MAYFLGEVPGIFSGTVLNISLDDDIRRKSLCADERRDATTRDSVKIPRCPNMAVYDNSGTNGRRKNDCVDEEIMSTDSEGVRRNLYRSRGPDHVTVCLVDLLEVD